MALLQNILHFVLLLAIRPSHHGANWDPEPPRQFWEENLVLFLVSFLLNLHLMKFVLPIMFCTSLDYKP